MKKLYFLFCLAGILSFFSLHAQLTVQGGYTAQELAEILAGNNITVTNATLTGAAAAAGSFDGTNSNLNVSSGVILSTGNINDAPGPNAASNTGTNLNTNGTSQTDSLAGTDTHDAVTLEFDFQVQSDMIQFQYVFASEEYPEYAPPNNSSYNDVFAFFISGPGISGEENIALVPMTSNPVSINNINAITNNQYYIDNSGGQTVEYDAFTTVLTAKRTGLIPCNTYHLKLVIADAGDHIYDSGVFLEENSLVQGIVNIQAQTINSDNIALEGCIPASFDFSLQQPLDHDYQINYIIAGSATNGIDYQHIDNYIIIPQGQTSASIIINSIQDGFPEGQEDIMLIYQPEPCSEYDTAYLYIDDAQPIQFSIDQRDLYCYQDSSGEIYVDASGGFPPYTFHITDENDVTNLYPNDTITGLPAGTYSVQVYDMYGCKADALVIGGIFDADTTFLPDGSGVSYTSTIDISGFDSGETISDMSQLQQICANMEHSYLGDLQIKVIAPSGESVILKQFNGGGSCDLGEPVATGPIDGSAGSLITDPGNGFDYCFNSSPIYGTMVSESNNYTHTYVDNLGHNLTDNYLPAGSYTSYEPLSNLLGAQKNGTWTLEVTDQYYLDNGYIFNWNISLTSDLPDTLAIIDQPNGLAITANSSQPTCGNNNGAISVNVSGDFPPFHYDWNTGDTTQQITGLSSGTYHVTISDENGCSQDTAFSLSNVGSLQTAEVITPVHCYGDSTGTIALNTYGGTSPYAFVWSTGATTENINNIPTGNYSVTITDANGCQIIESFTVTQNPQITIVANTIENEYCGNANGNIDITTTGGSGSYAYNWNTGIHTEDIQNLSAGNYSITVTDAYGCTNSDSYTIINDVTSCSTYCNLSINNIQVTDDTCGSGQGAIDVTISNATTPYTISWSNSATTEDIQNLSYGTYSITVNDAAGCQATEDITVGNETGTLAISNPNITNETCGNANGSINITTTGGALPYAYVWSNGSTTEDISNLSADSYTIQITDANNCLLSETYTVNNNTGNLSVSSNITNEICGNGQGAINLTTSGGNGVISYLWNTGATTEDLNNISAGTYSVTVVDESNCTFTDSYTVANTTGNLTISYSVTNETCEQANGAIDITILSGGGGYSYLWNTGASTEDISGLSEGSYSCTVTDNNGCQAFTGSQYVFNTGGSLSISDVLISNEICNNGQGFANINVSGGDSNYVYLWSNGSTSQDLLNVHAGTYTVTVTDGNNCSSTHTVSILNTQGTLQLDNTIVTNEICGNDQGAVNIAISGGTLPYTYLWNNSATTEDISNLAQGNYICTITDNNGCEITADASVQNDASGLSFTQTVTNEICSNGSGNINLSVTGGTPPYTYSWNTGDTTQEITDLSAGNYACTITDNNGCELHTGNIIINNNSGTLSVSSVVTDETCGNSQGSIDLTTNGGTGPFTFIWSNSATTEDVSNLSAGIYDYTVTDNNGCTVSNSITINNISGTLSLDSIIIQNETCGNGLGSINLTVSGGTGSLYFIWSNSATTEDINNLSAGNYTCTITDDNGCEVETGNINVANDAGTLELTNIQTTNESCNNGLGSVNITLAGGVLPLTYNWSNGATTEDITGLSAGNYSCTITDANNCSVVVNASVQNNSGSLTVYNYIVTDEACSNGQGAIDITVQGGSIPYTFSWSNGATSEDISNLSAGNYSCYISDNSGCTTTFNTTVNNIGSNLTISNATVQNDICSSGNGGIDITVTGGTSPLLYNWSTGNTSEDLNNITAGNYLVTITDYNGCTVSNSYTVNNETGTLNIDTLIVTEETCGSSDGSIDLQYSGGISPISFLWSNGATTEDLNNIGAGNYNVTVTDQFGCYVEDSATITNNSSGFEVSNVSVTNEQCGDSTGSIDITVSGGQTPYTFNWSNGATTEDLSNLTQGNYACTVTDNNGCNIYLNEIVQNITNGLQISNTFFGDDHCNQLVGYIDLSVSGGTPPYNFNWSNGATTEDLNNISSGNYSCTITDNAGCHVVSNTIAISNTNNNINYSTSIANDTCNLTTGAVSLSITNGFSPYSFNWSTGDTTSYISGLDAGTYNFTITDITGCEFYDSETIADAQDPNLAFDFINLFDDTCNMHVGEISFQSVGSGYDYEFNGTPTTFTTFSGLSEGNYQISLINNTCRTDANVYLNNTATFNINGYTVINEHCGDTTGGISMNIVPAGTYAYQWSNGQTSANLTNVNAGTYSCTITSDAGCTDFFTATVNNIASFSVSGTSSDAFCGDSSGTINLSVTGATGTVNYLWNTGDTTQNLTNLPAGNYSVNVTNNSCMVSDNFTIDNNTGTLQVSHTIADDFCNQGQGHIDQVVTGTSGSYSVMWSTGDTTLNISGLQMGQYTVTINDGGCIYTDSYTVGNSGFFTVSHFIDQATCSTCSDGGIDLLINGQTGPYTFVWSNGATTEDVSGLVPGTYYVTITDNWGCTEIDSILVSFVTQDLTLSENVLKFNIYPNPNDGNFTIDYDLIDNNNGFIDIYNVVGEKVKSIKLTKSKGSIQVNITRFKQGIFFVHLFTKTKVITLPVVKLE